MITLEHHLHFLLILLEVQVHQGTNAQTNIEILR